MKGFWKIEGYRQSEKIFSTRVPGNLSEERIITIIQRLTCKHLSEDEIVAASLRKPKRTALLEPIIGRPPTNKRINISIGHTVDYVASYWREDECQEPEELD
jgi:hypothetical protein